MREHLVLTLSASLGSMGELAGHERRGGWSWPGRSSILGLCAAGLGIRRDGDFLPLDRLKMAVAIFDSGMPLRDFHTVQTVSRTVVKHPQSRGQALRLGRGQLDTTITLRDYRAGCLFGVALWRGDEDAISLSVLENALRQPRFTLYLGRKSCPLNAPLAPVRIMAATASEALQTGLLLPPWWGEGTAAVRGGVLGNHMIARQIATEEDGDTGQRLTRRDNPLDRRGWHFAPRQVRLAACEIVPDRTWRETVP